MTPAAIGIVAGRTLAAAVGGIGVFELWAWIWHGMPGMWLSGSIFLAGAYMLTRGVNRWSGQ